MADTSPSLCLASASPIRRRLLEAAGIRFDVDPADIPEEEVDDPSPERRASALAEAKALRVSARRPGRFVLGSDQVFTLDGRFLPKPVTMEDLRRKLHLMNGRTHRFDCGVALVRDGEVLRSLSRRAEVTFRRLPAAEIDAYAETREGLHCAGGYRLEEGGVRLVERIEGSHFTVLGLPMIDVVGVLGELGLIPGIFVERVVS